VTQNLKTALRYIRKEKLEVVIWADAICINQKDDKEKVTQLQIMGEIYNASTMVAVFLGGADKVDVEVLSFIPGIKKIVGEVGKKAILGLSNVERMDLLDDRIENHPAFIHNTRPPNEVPNSISKFADLARRDFPWKAYSAFTKLEYWKRVWVFQAFCITAQCRIILGSDEVDFETFAAAHTLLVVMARRTNNVLMRENFVLGNKILEEKKKVNIDENGTQTVTAREETSSEALADSGSLGVSYLRNWKQEMEINQTLIQMISTLENNRIMSMIGARKDYHAKVTIRPLIRLL